MRQQITQILKVCLFLIVLVGLWLVSFEQHTNSPLNPGNKGEEMLPLSYCQQDSLPPTRWWKFRAKIMVEQQLKNNGIEDTNLLHVMANTPRHLFVDSPYQKYAYSNSPLPIGANQTIVQPYIIALMTELLQLKKNQKILEVGTGSGYQTAILAQLAGQVYSTEPIKPLAKKAIKRLHDLGYINTKVKWGSGVKGWDDYAPYDAIIVTASLRKIPKYLTDQLKPGGRMVIPLGSGFYQELMVVTKKKDNSIKVQKIRNVHFVELGQP